MIRVHYYLPGRKRLVALRVSTKTYCAFHSIRAASVSETMPSDSVYCECVLFGLKEINNNEWCPWARQIWLDVDLGQKYSSHAEAGAVLRSPIARHFNEFLESYQFVRVSCVCVCVCDIFLWMFGGQMVNAVPLGIIHNPVRIKHIRSCGIYFVLTSEIIIIIMERKIW